MKITLAQFAATPDKRENLVRMSEMVTTAAASGAELVVFPEASMSTHDDLTNIPADGETLHGPHALALAELARMNGLGIVAGIWETSPDSSRVFNTTVFIDSAGELEASYRKVHLYDAFGFKESDFVVPAAPVATVIPLESVTVGLATCYDLRFPESSRFLIDAGANVLVIPAGWVPGPQKKEHWATLLRARAIENTAFVIGVNQAGPKYDGGSMVVDPDGVVVAELDDREQVFTFEIDVDVIDEVRLRNPSISNRQFVVSAAE